MVLVPAPSFGEDFSIELFMPPILAGAQTDKTSACDGLVGCYEGFFSDNCPGTTISGKLYMTINDKCSFSALSSFGVETSGVISQKVDSIYYGTGTTDLSGCGNFSINCRKINSSIFCNYRYDNGKTGSISNAVPVPCKPINQLKTELLAGSWVFTFKIITVFTDYYYLDINSVKESSSEKGEYYIYGTDEYGGSILAQYDKSLNQYTLYDPGYGIDMFYVFNFTGNGSVAGCYYQISQYDQSWSRCYPMIGTSLGKSGSGKTSIEKDARVDEDVQRQRVDEIQTLEKDKDNVLSENFDSRIVEEYQKVKSIIGNQPDILDQ